MCLPRASDASSNAEKAFLGKIIEVCSVSYDYKRTIKGLSELGIKPWRVYTFSSANTTEQTYNGTSNPTFVGKFCFAELPGSDVVYEVIQPVSGPNVFQGFLDKHGEGIHHTAWDMNNVRPFSKRIELMESKGFKCVQSGNFANGNHFAFFETEEATGTCFETIDFEDGFELPEPEEWYPEKPQ